MIEIMRILIGELLVVGCTFLIRRTEHDETVEVLDRPTALDEASREIVEQFGMRRRRGHVAEIVGRGDEAVAKMLLPDAVHEDARSHGIFRIDDGFCEVEASAAVMPLGAMLRIGRKNFEETARDDVALVLRFATNQYGVIMRAGDVG